MDLGMTGYQLVGGVVETAANGGHLVEVEVAAVDVVNLVVPFHAEIISFGVYIAEDFIAQAVDPVMELGSRTTKGGTITVLKDLTVGNSNTHVVDGATVVRLTKGDGDDDNVTALAADTDLDNGQVVFADLSGVTRTLTPGQILVLRHLTAASGAGGAYVPFVVLKVSGPDFRLSNVWREKQTGEAVGD